MPKKRKLSVDDKCRVCLGNEGCMSDIFSENLKTKINDLEESTSIQINNDEHLPKNICHVCLYKLDMWVEFKQQFLRSNTMLREHLGLSDVFNPTLLAKRKCTESQESLKESLQEEHASKKAKSGEPAATEVINESSKIQRSSDCELLVKEEDMSKDQCANMEDSEVKIIEHVTSTTGTSSKLGRRGKTTERRKASTKRWVARKRALLAATGENETDTDSITSEESQLSPVQKARAERIAKNAKINEASANDCKELRKSEIKENSKTVKKMDNYLHNEKSMQQDNFKDKELGKEASEVEKLQSSKKTKDENFFPHSIRSELVIDDSTFVVTSTLALAGSHLPSEPSQSLKQHANKNEINPEMNTDIIDAVQLRRVFPKSTSNDDKKFVERCLNIEVEGTELEVLQRVQSELAKFVELKLHRTLNSDTEKINVINNSPQSLEQKVYTIIERSIKKNIENSRVDGASKENWSGSTVSPEFVKEAIKSSSFQPQVVLERCEISESMKKLYVSEPRPDKKPSRRTDQTFVPPLGKRRSVRPLRYADYEDTLNSLSDDEIVASQLLEKNSGLKTYGSQKQIVGSSGQRGEENRASRLESSRMLSSLDTEKNQQSRRVERNEISVPENKRIVGERYMCGVCGENFETRNEAEVHIEVHRKPTIPTIKQIKQKMMRCKRCHEIVEARYVKSHVCNFPKSQNKQVQNNVKNTGLDSLEADREQEPIETKDPSLSKQPKPSYIPQSSETYTCFVCDKVFNDEEILKDHLQKHCDDISDEDGTMSERRIEEDEDDVKEVYQCAICGESVQTEDALESHVEKHLFDDEDDDNPNLINISLERTKSMNESEMIHECAQCSETFDSEMLLMLHMQAHEEEIAIAEWERRGVGNDQEQHVCVICDEIFTTEDELSEHLDVHNGNAHVCLLCDKPFLTLQELQAHVNTH